MREISNQQLHRIVTLFFLIIIGITMISSIGYQSTSVRLQRTQLQTINDAWILFTGNDTDSLVNLPASAELDDTVPVKITHYLPEDLRNNDVLLFYSQYASVSVVIDGDVRYETGIEEKRPFMKAPVSQWNMVPLTKEDSGKQAQITFVSPYGVYNGQLGEVYYGSRGDCLLMLWRNNGFAFGCSIILLMVAAFCLGICGIRTLYRNRTPILNAYCLLTGITGGYLLTKNSLLQCFTNQMFGIWLLHELLFLLIPIAYLLVIRCMMKRRKILRFLDIVLGVLGVLEISLVVLQVVGIVELVYSMVIIQYGVLLGYVVVTLLLWGGVFKMKRKDLIGFGVFQLLFAGAVIIERILHHVTYDLNRSYGAMEGISTVYVLFIGLLIQQMLLQWEKEREGKKAELEKQQREVIIRQMNPNMIFMSLNTILTLVKQQDKGAARLLVDLSQIIRYNFDTLRRQEKVSFSSELQVIIAYLEIQKAKRPELSFAIEDKVVAFQVMPMSIYRLVEKAVEHGLTPAKKEGRLILRSYERRDSYAIQIIDDGIGYSEEKLTKTDAIGYLAISQELEQTMNAIVEINSKPGKGTIVSVRIPKRYGIKEV